MGVANYRHFRASEGKRGGLFLEWGVDWAQTHLESGRARRALSNGICIVSGDVFGEEVLSGESVTLRGKVARVKKIASIWNEG